MSYRNKPRRKRSAIWTVNKDQLVNIVNKASSIADILRQLDIFTVGANRTSLMRRLEQENISVDHIPTGLDANKGRKFKPSNKALPNEIVFVENSKTGRNIVRRKIIKYSLIPYECAECGLPAEWHGKSLSLVLDHINGIPNDHRLENLRFLCPNCNSQTDTFCGRNIK